MERTKEKAFRTHMLRPMVTNCDKTLSCKCIKRGNYRTENFKAVFHTTEHQKTNKNVNYHKLEMRHTLAKHFLLNQEVSKKYLHQRNWNPKKVTAGKAIFKTMLHFLSQYLHHFATHSVMHQKSCWRLTVFYILWKGQKNTLRNHDNCVSRFT